MNGLRKKFISIFLKCHRQQIKCFAKSTFDFLETLVCMLKKQLHNTLEIHKKKQIQKKQANSIN